MSAPVFILIISKTQLFMVITVLVQCCNNNRHNNVHRRRLMRAFPWIGVYMYTYSRNSRKGNTCKLITSFILMYCLFYLIYMMSTIAITLVLFAKSRPGTINANFYGFLALNEFFTLLFLRTRSSLKYYPRASNLLMYFFLYYFNSSAYGFSELGLYLMIFSLLCL